MRPFTFAEQMVAGGVLMFFAYILAIRNGLRYPVAIGWTLFGLFFVMHPVAPEFIEKRFGERTSLIMRILGVALIAGGLIAALVMPVAA